MKAVQADQIVLLVVEDLEESEQSMLIKVVAACHDQCRAHRYASIQCILRSPPRPPPALRPAVCGADEERGCWAAPTTRRS